MLNLSVANLAYIKSSKSGATDGREFGLAGMSVLLVILTRVQPSDRTLLYLDFEVA